MTNNVNNLSQEEFSALRANHYAYHYLDLAKYYDIHLNYDVQRTMLARHFTEEQMTSLVSIYHDDEQYVVRGDVISIETPAEPGMTDRFDRDRNHVHVSLLFYNGTTFIDRDIGISGISGIPKEFIIPDQFPPRYWDITEIINVIIRVKDPSVPEGLLSPRNWDITDVDTIIGEKEVNVFPTTEIPFGQLGPIVQNKEEIQIFFFDIPGERLRAIPGERLRAIPGERLLVIPLKQNNRIWWFIARNDSYNDIIPVDELVNIMKKILTSGEPQIGYYPANDGFPYHDEYYYGALLNREGFHNPMIPLNDVIELYLDENSVSDSDSDASDEE